MTNKVSSFEVYPDRVNATVDVLDATGTPIRRLRVLLRTVDPAATAAYAAAVQAAVDKLAIDAADPTAMPAAMQQLADTRAQLQAAAEQLARIKPA